MTPAEAPELGAVPLWLGAGAGVAAALHPFCVALVALAIVDLIARARARRMAGRHWTERAREAWTTRLSFRMVLGACFGMAAIGVGVAQPTPCLPAVAAPLLRIGGLALAYAVIAAIRRARPTLLTTPSFVTPRTVAFWVVMSPHLLALFGFLLPLDRLDSVAAGVVGGLLLAALVSLRFGWPIALGLGLARDASPRLKEAIARAAERTGVRPRLVVELDPRGGNAWAFPLSGVVAFTRGALDALDDEQLTAVGVHELGHLAEPRRISWARWAVSLVWLPMALMMPLVSTFGTAGLLAAFGPLLVARLLFQRVARRMEVASDSLATDHQGDTGVYATALERLYEHGLLPAVSASRRSVHPDLYDRLLAAGVKPDYPRPAPPGRLPAVIGLAVVLMAAIGGGAGQAVLYERILNDEDDGFPPELVAVVSGCDAATVASLGTDRLYGGDRDGADRWYKIAHALDVSGDTFSEHAAALAFTGDCDAADAWFTAARDRLAAAPEAGSTRDHAVMWLERTQTASRLCRDRIREAAPFATAGAQE